MSTIRRFLFSSAVSEMEKGKMFCGLQRGTLFNEKGNKKMQ